MHLLGWHIEACGHLRDVGVDGLGPAINVILGPNESGKSTTHWFLCGALFGFPDARSASGKRYRPDGSTLGGRVTLEHHGQTLLVRRAGRTLSLTDASGAPVTDRTLDDVTGRATRELYDAVFALGLDDLSFAGLDDRAVQEKIFAAAISGGRRSARSALGELDDRCSELLKPRSGTLRELVRALREGEKALGVAQSEARRLPELANEAEAAHAEVAAADEERQRAESRAGWLQRLLAHWAEYADVDGLREELAGLPDLQLGPDPLGALDRERREVERATENLARAQGEQTALEEQRTDLLVDESVAALAPRIEVAHDELAGLTERRNHQTERQARLESTRAQLASECEQLLGQGWDLDRLRTADVSVVARNRLHDAATERRATLQGVQHAEGEHQVAATALERHLTPGSDERIADEVAAAGLAPDVDLTAVHRDLRWLGRTLPELRATRLLETHERDKAEHRRHLEALAGTRSPVMPSWLVPALGVLAAALAVAAALALVGGEMVVGLLTVLVAIGAVGLLAAVHRTVPSVGDGDVAGDNAPDDAHGTGGDGAAATSSQELAARVAEVAVRCGLTREPRDDEIAAREEAVALLVRRAELATQLGADREAAQTRATATAGELEAVRRADEQAAARWQALVTELALPETLPIEGFDGVVTQIDRLRRNADELDTLTRDVAVEQAALDAIAESHEQLLIDAEAMVPSETADADSGVMLDHTDRNERIVDLHQRLQADLVDRTRLAALTTRSKELELEVAAARRALANAESVLAERLDQAGVGDPAAFEVVVGRVARRTEIESRLETEATARRSAFGVGDPCERARVELAAADPAAWTDELATLTDTLAELSEAHEQAVRHSQDIDRRLREAQESAAVADRAAEVERLRVEAADAARTWCELALARTAIEHTLSTFERERQPEVVRNAAGLYARTTGNRWSSVVPGDDGFHVQDPDGLRLPSDLLSRGAADQLYLAMRLALACSHARQAEPLPMLLDDVLVNADDTRRQALASELAEVADTLQLIVFTASDRHAEMLAATRSDTTVIELHAGQGTARAYPETMTDPAGQSTG